jgi:hypothetical protein
MASVGVNASPWGLAASPRAAGSGATLTVLLAGALAVGAVGALRPVLTLTLCLALAAGVWVAVRPALGGYLLIAITPLIVGINRGSVLPLLRPSEALALAIGTALAARAILSWRAGELSFPRVSRVEAALLLMALSDSVVPMVWLLARGQAVTTDDVLYALVLWKYLGIYLIVRASIRTERQVLICLWLSIASAVIVAVLAILQSLELFGVPALLVKWYAPFGYTGALNHARGSSTIALPAATADLMIFNLAIAAGLWRRGQHRLVLAGAGVVFAMGALAAGEFSSAIGLLVGICSVALITNYPRLLSMLVPFGGIAFIALRPVIATRLSGFQSLSGLPVSWTGRLQNLRSYFWPPLFQNWNFLFGVRPSARVHVPFQATGYVWIESGYTWLLWGGGIPLFLSFIYFVRAALTQSWRSSRRSIEPSSAAALAVFVAVCVVVVLMLFDPHITYRGAAEELFSLLALCSLSDRLPRTTSEVRARPAEVPL